MKRITDRLHPATRLAIQVLVALAITKFLSDMTQLPRPYWGYITVVSVLCQTWGESLRKSAQRVLATLAGLTLGVIFNIPLEHMLGLQIVFLMLGLFYMSYYITVSYARAMFAMSFMLTMIFATSDMLTIQIVYARIIQTLAGAAIAILTGLTVLRAHPKDDLREAAAAFLQTAGKAYTETIHLLTGESDPAQRHPTRIHLQHEFKLLKEQYETYLREATLLRAPALESRKIMSIMQSISFYHTNLRHTAYGNRTNPACALFEEELRRINALLGQNFDRLAEYIRTGDRNPAESIEPMRLEINEKVNRLLHEQPSMRPHLLDLLPIFYFARKVNRRILDFQPEER